MSKKHFIAFANRIAQIENKAQRQAAAEAVADVAAALNSKFDRAKFFTYCGL